MFSIYIISLVLIGLSGVLLDTHRRSWRAAQQDATLSDRDRLFARSQYRRRMQASGIIGLIGAAIAVWPIARAGGAMAVTIYVAALGGACIWIMMLAALDLWATRVNYERMRSEQLAAQVKLVREMTRDDG